MAAENREKVCTDKRLVRDATSNCREQRGALDYRRTSNSLIKLRVDSTPGVRCNEKPITQSHRNFFHRENGVYKIDAGTGKVIVYCVLSDSHGCGRGGYTLVMKIDGNKASAGFSLGLNDRAQRPVVFPQRPVVFSAACHFPRALWFLWAFISLILSLKLRKASN